MARLPMYQQIADAIRRQIEDGTLPRGEQMPNEQKLQEEFGASRNTIREAIRQLVDLGLVETRPGQGTFVKPEIDPWVTIRSMEPDPDLQELKGSVDPESAMFLSEVPKRRRKSSRSKPRVGVEQPAPRAIRVELKIDDEEQVVLRSEQRFIDGIPWAIVNSYYSMELVRKGASNLLMAQDMDPGVVAYLAETVNVRQTGYRDWITVRAPSEEEQKFFGILQTTAVYEIYRTGFDQDKKPMRVTVTISPVDRNQFIYDVGENLPAPQYDLDADSG